MASSVFLQDPQGVVGPLTFTVELHTPGQAVILHLDVCKVQGKYQDEDVQNMKKKKKKKLRRSKVLYNTHLHHRMVQDTFFLRFIEEYHLALVAFCLQPPAKMLCWKLQKKEDSRWFPKQEKARLGLLSLISEGQKALCDITRKTRRGTADCEVRITERLL